MDYLIRFSIQEKTREERDRFYNALQTALSAAQDVTTETPRTGHNITFGPNNVVQLRKAANNKLGIEIRAQDEKAAREEIAALVGNLNDKQTQDLLQKMFNAQKAKSYEKVLLGKMKAEFEQALADGVERQKQALATGNKRGVLNQANRKPEPKVALEFGKEHTLTIDHKAIAAIYNQHLQAQVAKLNENNNVFKSVYDNSGDYMIAGISGSKGNQLDINMRNGFSATTSIITPETSLMLVAAGKAYHEAYQKTHPEQDFPGFVLRCETHDQAQTFQALFARENLPIQKIHVSQARPDEAKVIEPKQQQHAQAKKTAELENDSPEVEAPTPPKDSSRTALRV